MQTNGEDGHGETSELERRAIDLSCVDGAAIHSNWHLYPPDFVPVVSLNGNESYGSIEISLDSGSQWTTAEQRSSGDFRDGSLALDHECPVLTGAIASIGHNSSRSHHLEIPSGDCEGMEETYPAGINSFFNPKLKVLFQPFLLVGDILQTAGMVVDSQIGSVIIAIFGVVTPVLTDSSSHLSKVDYFLIGVHALSCLLIFCSWMFKPTSSTASSSHTLSAKERKLQALSHGTAGGAIICTTAGVFYNIFSPLPLAYAICSVSVCVAFVLGAASYKAFQ